MEQHEGHAKTAELPAEECLALLGSVNVGRIAWIAEGVPHILPVNHRMLHGKVVLRTSDESQLGQQSIGAPVAFEVDNVDYGHLTGWSVVVNGTCRAVDGAEARAMAAGNLTPWVEGKKALVLTIEASSVTGRRLVEQAPADRP